MAEKKSPAKKLAVKVRDLAPQHDLQGGTGYMYSKSPALAIPPPGFIQQSVVVKGE